VNSLRISDPNSLRNTHKASTRFPTTKNPLTDSINKTDDTPVGGYTDVPEGKELEVKLVTENEEVPVQDNRRKGWFCSRLCRNYNRSFLFALGLQYFNTGMRSMITMAI
jgi:hypothetical protein